LETVQEAPGRAGCNVLLVQKSILRDAVMDLSLDFCAKARAAFSNFSRTFVIDVSRFSRFVSDFSSQDSGRFSLKSYPS
jgi:hypothetical protein